jgi:hypothetical protein
MRAIKEAHAMPLLNEFTGKMRRILTDTRERCEQGAPAHCNIEPRVRIVIF